MTLSYVENRILNSSILQVDSIITMKMGIQSDESLYWDFAMVSSALSQYIIRNSFSVEKLTYNDDTGTVIYGSKPVLNSIQ